MGVGGKNKLPQAAAINWVLKDGLGRLGRLTVATSFGESFDSDLKVHARPGQKIELVPKKCNKVCVAPPGCLI